jgi:predicted DNA binding CopG/RHH family protein
MPRTTLRLPSDVLEAAKRKASSVRLTLSGYIRALIERDLQKNGGWWKPR